jgi:hypothetical protein
MLNQTYRAARSSRPPDHGPIYAETNLDRVIAEPLNALSTLIFLAAVVYWAAKALRRGRRHPVTLVSLPILAVGFVGGFVYHATRSHRIWLMMDVFPILILALIASAYLWSRVLGRVSAALLLTLASVGGFPLIHTSGMLPRRGRFVSGYVYLALIIILPAFLSLVRRGWRQWHSLALAAGSFAAAVFFRQADRWVAELGFAPGSHFLWHLFGGIATFFVMRYLYDVEEESAASRTSAHVVAQATES